MATLLLALAVGSTGLYAGFLLIFQTGIMPALGRLTDPEFVTAMRRINECVPRAVFLTVFLGVVAFPAAAFLVPVDGRTDAQRWLVLAGLAAAVLNHAVTIGGNVPLNTALAASEQAPAGDPAGDPSAARAAFEKRWNAFHRVRTALITLAFGLLTTAAVL
ncbi:anthrone oxygenase family protein [Streptomyces litmocidini]|uniref:anthrone oxygenase family protein n=1 Tax=Streptomyces litmocidini TaxID=67318 RepID=UPI0036F84786